MLVLLLLAAGVLVALATLMGVFQRKLIYLPMGRAGTPRGAGLPSAQEVTLQTEDGLRLDAWLVPSARGTPAPGVLFFPGNAGNRALRAPLAATLSASGLSVLLVDYRGYAGNPGSPTEEGLAADARAAAALAAARPEIDPSRLVYFGESLGTGVAVRLAAERPPAALILRSPYASLTSVAKRHYPFLPVGLLLRDRYPSIDRIAGIEAPLLIVAGDRDSIIPLDESRRLFDAAGEPKHLAVIPGADHNDMALLAGARLLRDVLDFLRRHEILEPAAPDAP